MAILIVFLSIIFDDNTNICYNEQYIVLDFCKILCTNK